MVQEGEMERCWSKGTKFQLCWINEAWRPKVTVVILFCEYGDCSQ